MSKIVKYWYVPILIFLLAQVMVFFNTTLTISPYSKQYSYFSYFSIVLLLISIVYQLFNNGYFKALISMVILLVTIIFSWFVTFAFFLAGVDQWADDLKIPKNIQIDEPLNLDNYQRSDSLIKFHKSDTNLVLFNSWQPGIYEYQFWTTNIENGSIYLKAFEITQNIQLSSKRLKTESKIKVNESINKKVKFTSESFKISEGDWGKYYAARFEVWFEPSNGDKERKIFQKNFKIEGWMH